MRRGCHGRLWCGTDEGCWQAQRSAGDRDWMERAMSLAAVPDGNQMHIAGTGVLQPGRQLRTWGGGPVAWVTDWAYGSAGIYWTWGTEESAESGLQPVLLADMTREGARP